MQYLNLFPNHHALHCPVPYRVSTVHIFAALQHCAKLQGLHGIPKTYIRELLVQYQISKYRVTCARNSQWVYRPPITAVFPVRRKLLLMRRNLRVLLPSSENCQADPISSLELWNIALCNPAKYL